VGEIIDASLLVAEALWPKQLLRFPFRLQLEIPMSSRSKISLEDKKRLVRAFENEEDYMVLADQLNINRGSAKSIIYRTLKRDGVIQKQRGGAMYSKVDEEMRNEIVRIVEENSAITLRGINEELKARLPNKNHIGKTTISNVLEGQLISMKVLQTSPAERNREDVKIARREYADWILREGQLADDLVFIDESGYNIWTKRTFGRARKGQCATRKVGGQRGRNLTLKLAISPRLGVIAASFHSGGTTKEIFQGFIDEVSSNLGDASVFLIMDNAPCHRGATSSNAQHRIKYLPAYSPMLNPIEESFSAWKSVVKSVLVRPMTQQRIFDNEAARQQGVALYTWRRNVLQEVGQSALSTLTVEKCNAWYRHSLTFLPLCQQMADIL